MTPETRRAIADVLRADVAAVAPVGGGCISPAYRAQLASGAVVFVKTAPRGAPARLLDCEAFALRALRDTGTVRVPDVLAATESWLALEWLEPAPPTPGAWRALGGALARLHRAAAERRGWHHDNYIGTLPQSNAPLDPWPEFWAERRLRPQLELAAAQLSAATLRRFERLLRELPERLGEATAEPPSLLHGDLWSGNVHMSTDGPALIDPSCYYGHREVDHAMSRLFGGFAAAFYDAYAADWPLLSGADARLPIYQLYYLLVHVNLFGASYIAATERALADALR